MNKFALLTISLFATVNIYAQAPDSGLEPLDLPVDGIGVESTAQLETATQVASAPAVDQADGGNVVKSDAVQGMIPGANEQFPEGAKIRNTENWFGVILPAVVFFALFLPLF